MVRGTRAAIYTYLATVYTTLGIMAPPTRPTRPGQARQAFCTACGEYYAIHLSDTQMVGKFLGGQNFTT